jgi:hypothetical protein
MIVEIEFDVLSHACEWHEGIDCENPDHIDGASGHVALCDPKTCPLLERGGEEEGDEEG